MAQQTAKATFGAGCYWGTEKFFRQQFGGAILRGAVGFMGGSSPTVDYRMVCSGTTGHAEVFHMEYNPATVSFVDLLQLFFRMHNPTKKNMQGNDHGTQYRSVIFYHTEEQKQVAEEFIEKLRSDGPLRQQWTKAFGADRQIETTIEPAGVFVQAHDGHQQYLARNSGGYCNHRLYW